MKTPAFSYKKVINCYLNILFNFASINMFVDYSIRKAEIGAKEKNVFM